MPFYPYGIEEIEYLKRKDKKLAQAIERIGLIKREIFPEPFPALIQSIVSQQISTKAAITVWDKFSALLGTVTAENILNATDESIQKCGMSHRKVSYIKDAAQSARSGLIDFSTLHLLSDEEIVRKLVQIRGVGEWTAEMMLIFTFMRPDVVSYKDLAICRGMMNVYGLKELTKETFEKYRKRYSPYGTVASLYLWAMSVEEK